MFSKEKNKKRNSLAGVLLTVLTLGTVENKMHENTQYRNNVTEYVQEKYANRHLEQKKGVFFRWNIVKNNPETLARPLDRITHTNLDKINESNIEDFVEIRKQLLQNIVNIHHNQYKRSSPEYNEVLNRVIPGFIEYLKIEKDLLPEEAKKTIEFAKYSQLLEKKK